MKHQLTYLLLGMALCLASCGKDDVIFTYSPAEPRAGQTIIFSNQTSEGEEWAWDFGDGSTSTSKSPSKVYKRPGTYTVTLKVDDKASRTYAQTLTVIDTIPAINCSDSLVYYYEPVTFTANAYNPYSYDLSYHWTLPEGTVYTQGDSASHSITVFFTQTETELNIECQLTQGSTTWDLDTKVYIHDTKASALVIAEPGKLLHQRIYKNGFERAIPYSIPAAFVTAPTDLCIANDMLYIFNADNTAGGMLMRYGLATTRVDCILINAGTGEGQGFEHGFITGRYVYWTVGDRIYKALNDIFDQPFNAAATSMLLTSADGIGYGLSAGLSASGIALCNGIIYYAYPQGVHRFMASEIGSTPAEGSILTDKTITAMALDPIAQKIYFTTTEGLHVSNFAGNNIVRIDPNANGKSIAVDNTDNFLFWTTNSGVFYMPLVQTANNISAQQPVQLNDMAGVTALTIDNTKR